jgi:hypothetical protein
MRGTEVGIVMSIVIDIDTNEIGQVRGLPAMLQFCRPTDEAWLERSTLKA